MTTRPIHRNDGFVLIAILLMMVIISLLTITASQLVTTNYRLSATNVFDSNAQLAADAAVDEAIQKLAISSSWAGSSETELQNTTNFRSTYQSSVESIDSSTRKITVTGKLYYPSSAANASSTRKYEVIVKQTVSPAYNYSAVSGLGGLTMVGNSDISNGDVYVNGKLTMDSNAAIGSSFKPLNVRVAHMTCPVPADATYPRVCNNGEAGQPISMGSINNRIYGTVMANNQTDGSRMSSPGLVTGTVYPTVMPSHNRQSVKDAITTTVSSSVGSCDSNETRTWSANTKFLGNLIVDGNCRVIIEGTIWVTGNFTITSNGRITVKSGLSVAPTMMIDGNSGAEIDGDIVPNSSSVGAYVIAYRSSAACSPDCIDVTGANLASSQNYISMDITGNASLSKSEVYARWGTVNLDGNGDVGAIAGQRLLLGSNASVSFSKKVTFGDGANNWNIVSYTRAF